MVAETETSFQTEPLTVADYDRLPDDRLRYELVDGELIEMPAPSYLHQLAQADFLAVLYFFVMQRGLGRVVGSPIDVHLGEVVLQPDVVYLSNERYRIGIEDRIVEAPDLIIQIQSPSTRKHDLTTKRDMYRIAGVREYWVIELEARTATVRELVEDRYVEQRPDADGQHVSRVLPGFAVDVAAVE